MTEGLRPNPNFKLDRAERLIASFNKATKFKYKAMWMWDGVRSSLENFSPTLRGRSFVEEQAMLVFSGKLALSGVSVWLFQRGEGNRWENYKAP